MAGCAATPLRPESITPEAGMALVVGWGNTVDENLREALTPTENNTRVSRLYVSQANGRKFSLGTNVARLAPGSYELTVSCGLYIGLWFYRDTAVVAADLAADHVYRLRAQPDARRCYPYLEDATGKNPPL